MSVCKSEHDNVRQSNYIEFWRAKVYILCTNLNDYWLPPLSVDGVRKNLSINIPLGCWSHPAHLAGWRTLFRLCLGSAAGHSQPRATSNQLVGFFECANPFWHCPQTFLTCLFLPCTDLSADEATNTMRVWWLGPTGHWPFICCRRLAQACFLLNIQSLLIPFSSRVSCPERLLNSRTMVVK